MDDIGAELGLPSQSVFVEPLPGNSAWDVGPSRGHEQGDSGKLDDWEQVCNLLVATLGRFSCSHIEYKLLPCLGSCCSHSDIWHSELYLIIRKVLSCHHHACKKKEVVVVQIVGGAE
ncbi:unnamed protein product [Heterosigma akashiwo]